MIALRRILVAALACSLSAAAASAQPPDAPPGGRRFWLGSSAMMLANLVPDDYPAYFAQVNAGYRLTPVDSVSLEAVTWRYYHPLGIPWGEDWGSAAEEYPGHVREYGVGVAYQRFLWRGAYASLSAIPLLREYRDTSGRKLATGFQLFMTARLGYQVRFLERAFVEPSVAFTAWPVTTGAPTAFAERDARWPRYFLFEPGLHVGVEL